MILDLRNCPDSHIKTIYIIILNCEIYSLTLIADALVVKKKHLVPLTLKITLLDCTS